MQKSCRLLQLFWSSQMKLLSRKFSFDGSATKQSQQVNYRMSFSTPSCDKATCMSLMCDFYHQLILGKRALDVMFTFYFIFTSFHFVHSMSHEAKILTTNMIPELLGLEDRSLVVTVASLTDHADGVFNCDVTRWNWSLHQRHTTSC